MTTTLIIRTLLFNDSNNEFEPSNNNNNDNIINNESNNDNIYNIINSNSKEGWLVTETKSLDARTLRLEPRLARLGNLSATKGFDIAVS